MTETADKDATGNRRSAARLVAVQALYEMDMVNAEVDAVLEEFLQKRWRQGDDEGDGDGSDNGDNASLTEPDQAWLNDLVHGVSAGREELDGLIGPALSEDWTVDRLEALLRVILRAGTYELKIKKNIPAAVIISEYLDVAHAFFEGGETRMVNGVLDHLARDLRAKDG
ncbi:MAG TPA: transcription antitermination factor NusB [Rhodospirillales bacterium]|jgi:N utilization substance protein B|nr:transcription antitermination factor NusB [Rhodospirillales bacterium]